jgi:hypothetical protein
MPNSGKNNFYTGVKHFRFSIFFIYIELYASLINTITYSYSSTILTLRRLIYHFTSSHFGGTLSLITSTPLDGTLLTRRLIDILSHTDYSAAASSLTGVSQSQSHITTDGQSVIMSRYRAHSGTCDQILLSVRRLFSGICCLVFLNEVGSVICRPQSSNLLLFTSIIYVRCVLQFSNLYVINTKLQSVPF